MTKRVTPNACPTFLSLTRPQYAPKVDRAALDVSVYGYTYDRRNDPHWSPQRALNSLSRREIQVIFQVAQGKTNEEIGAELGLTYYTIKSHLQNITRKTRVGTRYELVTWSFRMGLLQKMGLIPIATPPSQAKFTSRETEMIHWIVRGLTNKQISNTVFISEDTVKTHVRRVFKKTGARDRAHLITLAWQYQIIPREAWEEDENESGKGAGEK